MSLWPWPVAQEWPTRQVRETLPCGHKRGDRVAQGRHSQSPCAL